MDVIKSFQERDDLNRKPLAEKLISLLQSDIAVSPMVIDGQWGTGKTEFCHKTITLLNEQAAAEVAEEGSSYKVIYIDAFKADHADQALVTLLSAVLGTVDDQTELSQKIREKAVPVLRTIAKGVGKSAVSWVLRDQFKDVEKELTDLVSLSGDAVIETLLDDHADAEKNLEALKDALIEATEEQELLIFIDELDRCRPDFSVQMLENIKHVFDMESVKFVLLVNIEQLEASLNHVYGAIDASRYLDKFIGFRFSLPSYDSVTGYNPNLVVVNAFKGLIHDSDLNWMTQNGYLDFLKVIFLHNNTTIREVETFHKHLCIYQQLNNNKGLPANIIYGAGLIRILAIFIFCFNKKLLVSLSNKLTKSNVGHLFQIINISIEARPESTSHEPTEIFALYLIAITKIETPFQYSEEELQQILDINHRSFPETQRPNNIFSNIFLDALNTLQMQ